jgi:hypothetical protein
MAAQPLSPLIGLDASQVQIKIYSERRLLTGLALAAFIA